ncbi:hypothetical protein D3C78_1941120 [compost metagenome]
MLSTGTVISAPRAPNSSMLLRRPMRSDSAPNSGCMHMYRNRHAVITLLAVLIDMPTVFTRYFCM